MKTLRQSSVLAVDPADIGDAVDHFKGARLSDKTIRLVCEQVEAKCRIGVSR
jgi:hypothetical protein